ncbi:hypothetical protein EON65_34020 [archaeon]|nr:MAG: hypothetical protein EON65_34020 [archaeon]
MEVLTEALNLNRGVLIAELQQLRELDRATHAELLKVRQEEASLISELQTAIKEGKPIDEAAMAARQQMVVVRRCAIVRGHEQQVQGAQSLYDQLDGQYNYLCECTSYSCYIIMQLPLI